MKYENYALYMKAIVYHMNHLQKRKELPEESATNTEGNSINLFPNINYNSI
jgi:hypothetical protein